ncbi:MAG: DUF1990 family protein [Proteobacteria bacterium]|nr:MAG: DUF1990 family protein [Pseudomonadota bacterium]
MTELSNVKQSAAEGVGALFHRKYRVHLGVAREHALFTMALLQANINEFAPQLLAKFEKAGGENGTMKEGDCYQIYISGPWNGPVRVAKVFKEGFTFETLVGHMEAGEILFKVEEILNELYFTIESVARSKDALVDLVYDKVPVARLAQTTMWISVCRTFAAAALRVQNGVAEKNLELNVEVQTEKKEDGSLHWEKA